MLTFPSPRTQWKLDAVSILAILGEKNIGLNSHLILSSKTCLLPRLLPAPQGLYADRLDRLPTEPVKICGVFSGNVRESLSYFGQLLHGTGQELPDFSVREIRLKLKRDKAEFRLRWLAPLNALAVGSSVVTVGLLIWAALIKDGVAVVGIIIMAFTTAVLCLASNWRLKPRLTPRIGTNTPPGDVVLRHTKGCFTVVKCDESVARLIYFGPEEIEYLLPNPTISRFLGGIVGGLTLTTAIVMFGNSTWTMQVALSVTYAVLNALYWGVAVLPPKFSWDLSAVEMEERTYDAPAADEEKDQDTATRSRTYETMPTFTRALFRAIQFSGTTEWVLRSDSCPNTPVWNEWLRQAQEQLEHPTAGWDCQQALSKIIVEHKMLAAASGLERSPVQRAL
ncbi:hypothetical protein NA57DRAFT_38661 [Rhizodiscina lignyota]|uniref:Uncharacterized protein n=1 Tax=Rhizodiscina lignyota TaxID=1504668 RepID=A0A9P4IE46_9PEZI|nr:hypothetical protein NA57DRAFT_38661 [Rhizodiscina lignyota]